MTDDELREAFERGWDTSESGESVHLAGLRAVAEAAVRAHDRQADDRCRECTGTPASCLRSRIKCCPDCTHTAAQLADDVPVSRELLQRLTLPFDTHSLALFFAQVEARNLLDADNPSDE